MTTTRYGLTRHAPARQTWAPGDAVRVGFVSGLTVIARVPTPGDGAPDIWALCQRGTGRWYQFVPHCGLYRVEDEAAALTA